MIRIIGGEYRSRILQSPDGSDVTRPMAARVKESLFNLLRGWFDGTTVLDLFAGVGTIGLEAVSRGARHVTMVEQNRAAFRALEANIAALGCEDRVDAVNGDALSTLVLSRVPKPVDVVFLDPPYRLMEAAASRGQVFDQIIRCRDILARPSFVVLRTPEMPATVDMGIPGFEGPEVHDYGHNMQANLYMPME